MVIRAPASNAFEFVIVAALRARQLMRGCVPRIPLGPNERKAITTAQLEVVDNKVVRLVDMGPQG